MARLASESSPSGADLRSSIYWSKAALVSELQSLSSADLKATFALTDNHLACSSRKVRHSALGAQSAAAARVAMRAAMKNFIRMFWSVKVFIISNWQDASLYIQNLEIRGFWNLSKAPNLIL